MVDVPLTWLGAGDLIAGSVLQDGAAVLLVDLADPRLESLRSLAPTVRDVQDAGKPIAGPREHFLARRALLRHLVAGRLGVPAEEVVIGHAEDGRPELVAPQAPLHVSVSARGTLAALAISTRPVGVDIEPVGDPREPVWEMLHARERGGVEAAWKKQGADWPFLSIWTAKEAYLKALGLGLKREPARLDVRYEGDETFIIHDPDAQPRQYRGETCRGEIGEAGIICSVIALPA